MASASTIRWKTSRRTTRREWANHRRVQRMPIVVCLFIVRSRRMVGECRVRHSANVKCEREMETAPCRQCLQNVYYCLTSSGSVGFVTASELRTRVCVSSVLDSRSSSMSWAHSQREEKCVFCCWYLDAGSLSNCEVFKCWCRCRCDAKTAAMAAPNWNSLVNTVAANRFMAIHCFHFSTAHLLIPRLECKYRKWSIFRPFRLMNRFSFGFFDWPLFV